MDLNQIAGLPVETNNALEKNTALLLEKSLQVTPDTFERLKVELPLEVLCSVTIFECKLDA